MRKLNKTEVKRIVKRIDELTDQINGGKLKLTKQQFKELDDLIAQFSKLKSGDL